MFTKSFERETRLSRLEQSMGNIWKHEDNFWVSCFVVSACPLWQNWMWFKSICPGELKWVCVRDCVHVSLLRSISVHVFWWRESRCRTKNNWWGFKLYWHTHTNNHTLKITTHWSYFISQPVYPLQTNFTFIKTDDKSRHFPPQWCPYLGYLSAYIISACIPTGIMLRGQIIWTTTQILTIVVVLLRSPKSK